MDTACFIFEKKGWNYSIKQWSSLFIEDGAIDTHQGSQAVI